MKIIYSILLVIITLQLIGCGGADQRKAAYLKKADKAINRGDLEEARIDLKNVLQIDPKDASAYYKLGKVFEGKKNFRTAFGYYNKAAQLEPENAQYQAQLGKYYLLLAGDMEKAKEKMNLALSHDNNNVYGLRLKAAILMKQNKIEEAKNLSEKILKDHPDNVPNILFLSSIYNKQANYNAATKLLNDAIKSDPQNIQLNSMLADVQYSSKDYQAAESTLKGILHNHPDKFSSYLTLARFYKDIKRPEEAEAVLRNAVAAKESDTKRMDTLIKFIQNEKGPAVAIKEINKLITKYPDQSELRLALASMQIMTNDIDGAIATYKKTISDFSDEQAAVTSQVNLAKLYMQRNDVETASKYINQAAETSPNDTDVNLVKGRIAVVNHDYDDAVASFRNVVKNKPDEIPAYVLLSEALRADMQPDQAKQVMDNAFQNNRDNPKALLQLATYYGRARDLSNAEKVIDAFLTLDANNYDALSIKASLLNEQKEYAEADKYASKLIKLYPDKDNGYIQSVPQLLSTKDYKKAIDLMDTGYKNTGSSSLLEYKSKILLAESDPEKAIKFIGSIDKKDTNESLQLLLANAYLKKHDDASAKKVLSDSIAENAAHIRSYIALANIYISEKNTEKGISIVKEGIKANPNSQLLSEQLAEYYQKKGDYDNAITAYEHLIEKFPNKVVATNNLASLLADHKTDPASLKLAKSLVDTIKMYKQAPIQDTVGWVYYRLGEYTKAIDVLKNVVSQSPDTQIFNYHLGMAYYKNGDKANAKKYLEKSVSGKQVYTGIDEANTILKSL